MCIKAIILPIKGQLCKNLGRPNNRSSQPDDSRRDVEHVGTDKLVKYKNTQLQNIQIQK